MIKVVLIGSGNLASHLSRALILAPNIDFVQRLSRNNSNSPYFDPSVPVIRELSELTDADIYILAVNDDSIENLSKQLKHLQGLVVHTSGSVAMRILDPQLRRGVLYPAQSFSLEKKIDFKKVPLVLETENEHDYKLLSDLASELSDRIYKLDSAGREKLHVAAVFANNFSNYMFYCAEELCIEAGISFDILKPMIMETGMKVQELSPGKSQTGPAIRNDLQTINRHLEQLKGDKKVIYENITDAIIKSFKMKEKNGKKL
ncbi:Rossmann-like and DUF2520 domain-containing protein [Lutimonas zeaxanthinifaciens]|uniref:Rossmann-like and DUF2520 domain-containing protein n=1 Tax=Lutimonas zeaxanthinifaciens TaxID=3060215 RepID=UPI00265CA022|nr:Rossmann-like and DUF2520 domain-containing protein [Lutimonas sp. YSD2104]WKK67255.1 DUF2520 domain-containing protein [Lutimonas sp. YSD2104]